ncbi:MAG: glycosyltransferase [Candidatus Korobacteraceae bacterium]
MHLSAVIAGFVCVILWLYLLLAHGRFWRVQRLGATEARSAAVRGPIAVVIPARNEADVIGEAIRSLLQQSCADAIHIFLVDDDSADGTAEAAREAAANSSPPNALTIIRGQPLPDGWTGKLWAMQQGIEQALRLHPQFLLLTDADIQHSPENVATLVSVAECGGYHLTSFMVKLHCDSLPEKLLIPAFMLFFFMLYPPEWIRNPWRKIAGAAGGCILIRPEALARAGGVTAIRGEIIDDCALARRVKLSGGKVWLGVTTDASSMRAYQSFGEIERMIARTAFNQLQHSTWLLLGAVAGLVLIYLLPVGLLGSGSLALVLLGAVAYLLMWITYSPMVRFYGLNAAWALTLPFSAAFYLAATVHSAVKYWSGRGGEWKGRTQDTAPTP